MYPILMESPRIRHCFRCNPRAFTVLLCSGPGRHILCAGVLLDGRTSSSLQYKITIIMLIKLILLIIAQVF